jgi:hypothetical protein
MDTQSAAQTSTRTSIQAVLAVVGSVCGTLLTGALTTSPTLKLVGAALGAAIPPLISQAGRFQQARAGVGIAVTVGALFLTYGGFTLFDAATGRPGTFPVPPVVQSASAASDRADSSAGNQRDNSGGACDGGICIEVTATSLSCTSDGCDPLTIKSTGSKPLLVRSIEFDGQAAADFHHGGECQDKELSPNDECALTVTFTPSSDGNLCAQGFVWREAFKGDTVCVEPSFRDQVFSDNAADSGRHEEGSDNCLQGWVWREARPSDLVCVEPDIRTQVAEQNADPTAHRASASGTRHARLVIHQNLSGPPTFVALEGKG